MTAQADTLLTLEQVAHRLGLHVKTVRRYVRDGQLQSVRIGKRSRVTKSALDGFMGFRVDTPAQSTRSGTKDVSSIVVVDELTKEVADRTTTHLLTAVSGRQSEDQLLRLETIYDPSKQRLKIIINGGLASTIVLLSLINVVLGEQ